MDAPQKLRKHYETRTPLGRVGSILGMHGPMCAQNIRDHYNKTWREGISMNRLSQLLSSHKKFTKVGTTTVHGLTGRSYETTVWEVIH